tara:strand:- start:4849 stop:9252 length:4404 start_codon:yes stop_codon:yes gene_type:complete
MVEIYNDSLIKRAEALGYEIEDIKEINKTTSFIQSSIQRLLGDDNEKEILRVAREVERQESSFISNCKLQINQLLKDEFFLDKKELSQQVKKLYSTLKSDMFKWESVSLCLEIVKKQNKKINQFFEILSLQEQFSSPQSFNNFLNLFLPHERLLNNYYFNNSFKLIADNFSNQPEIQKLCVQILDSNDMSFGPQPRYGGFEKLSLFMERHEEILNNFSNDTILELFKRSTFASKINVILNFFIRNEFYDEQFIINHIDYLFNNYDAFTLAFKYKDSPKYQDYLSEFNNALSQKFMRFRLNDDIYSILDDYDFKSTNSIPIFIKFYNKFDFESYTDLLQIIDENSEVLFSNSDLFVEIFENIDQSNLRDLNFKIFTQILRLENISKENANAILEELKEIKSQPNRSARRAVLHTLIDDFINELLNSLVEFDSDATKVLEQLKRVNAFIGNTTSSQTHNRIKQLSNVKEVFELDFILSSKAYFGHQKLFDKLKEVASNSGIEYKEIFEIITSSAGKYSFSEFVNLFDSTEFTSFSAIATVEDFIYLKTVFESNSILGVRFFLKLFNCNTLNQFKPEEFIDFLKTNSSIFTSRFVVGILDEILNISQLDKLKLDKIIIVIQKIKSKNIIKLLDSVDFNLDHPKIKFFLEETQPQKFESILECLINNDLILEYSLNDLDEIYTKLSENRIEVHRISQLTSKEDLRSSMLFEFVLKEPHFIGEIIILEKYFPNKQDLVNFITQNLTTLEKALSNSYQKKDYNLENAFEKLCKNIHDLNTIQEIFKLDFDFLHLINCINFESPIESINILNNLVQNDLSDKDNRYLFSKFNFEELGLNEQTHIYAKFVCKYREQFGYDLLLEFFNKTNLKNQPVENLKYYFEYSKLDGPIDKHIINSFIDVYKSQSKEEAFQIIEKIKIESRNLIDLNLSQDQLEEYRSLPYYISMCKMVYPPGNYSTHEKNATLGDQTSHLDHFTFDRNGYETTLSGLLGYEVKEGMILNPEVIDAYSKRIYKIKDFVNSRDANQESLVSDFNNLVDQIFLANPDNPYIDLDLELNEKILSMILHESLKPAKDRDQNILDLLVIYKYVFQENLADYILESNTSVNKIDDEKSKEYLTLKELSVIYGENMKHIFQNEIFQKSLESPNMPAVQEIFENQAGEKLGVEDFKESQLKKLKASFENTKIPADRKPQMIRGTLNRLVSSNAVDLKDKLEKERFDKEFNVIFEKFSGEFTFEKFQELKSEFLQLRFKFKNNLESLVEQTIGYDINQILQEVNKYQEKLATGKKQRSMNDSNGEVYKKSSKERLIKGYFAKTQETTNARMGAYLCIAGDARMWENPNYFEFVLMDPEKGRCVGVVMLQKIELKNGKKYLFFGPNPFESFLESVSDSACLDFMYERVSQFALDNDFDGVVIPEKEGAVLGACTNRGGEFPNLINQKRIKDRAIIKYGENIHLGGAYSYDSGALIWENENKK